MKSNIIQEKTFAFALRIIKLSQYLVKEKNEFVISRQIMRCGTSIGANVEEGIGSYSKKEFLLKITIAYKEARETHYWLRLLAESKLITKRQFISIIDDCTEIIKILASIQKTIKNNEKNPNPRNS